MKRLAILLVMALAAGTSASGQDCQSVALEMKLPKKLKTRGKPPVARWEVIDRTLNDLQKALQGKACTFTFEQLFDCGKKGARFPLTNSVLRISPDGVFQGLAVQTKAGEELGRFEARVLYERSGGLYAQDSYSLYYFQFQDGSGQIQSVGSRLLLDEFTVSWEEMKGKTAISTD